MTGSGIKLVLTDVDGTLVRYQANTPSPAVKEVIEKLKRQGIQLTAATGRPYGMARDLFLDIGLRGPCIFDGGASILDAESGDIIWKNWLSTERLRSIAKILTPVAHEVDYFPVYNQVTPDIFSVSDIKEDAPYAFACINKSSTQGILGQLKELPDLTIHIDAGMPKYPDTDNLQITDIKADKFHAVKALEKLGHIKTSETLAIGDSSNDLPLFKGAGLKIAMGNATDELMAAADYIVARVEDDGFADAMKRFVLQPGHLRQV